MLFFFAFPVYIYYDTGFHNHLLLILSKKISFSKTPNLPYWAWKSANKWLKKTLRTKIGILYQCGLYAYHNIERFCGWSHGSDALRCKQGEQSLQSTNHKVSPFVLQDSLFLSPSLFLFSSLFSLPIFMSLFFLEMRNKKGKGNKIIVKRWHFMNHALVFPLLCFLS